MMRKKLLISLLAAMTAAAALPFLPLRMNGNRIPAAGSMRSMTMTTAMTIDTLSELMQYLK